MRELRHCAVHSSYAPKCAACWGAAYGVAMSPKPAGVKHQDKPHQDFGALVLTVIVVVILVAVAIVIGGDR